MSTETATQPTSRKMARQLAGIEVAKRRGTSPSAREMFAFLRPKLLASRPLIAAAEFAERPVFISGPRRGVRGSGGRWVNRTVQVKAPVYGKPTFRNVIDPETGALV